jgi:uncharacterized protein
MKRVHNGATRTTVNKSTAKNNAQPEKPYIIKRTTTGLGLITLKPISKGARIIEYFGPLVPNEEVEKRTGKYFFELNDKFSVDGSPRDNIARYINHSCRPNAEAIISRNERIWIWAKRDIKVGEEITYDYGKDYFENVIKPMGCRCVRCST